MRDILQTWCQIQRTSSSFRYVNCGRGQMQSIYSSAYSDFNIHLNISALLLEMPQQINASYTANWVPNTAHTPQFTLCELWSRSYTMHLQLRIFRLQYSTVAICAAIVDITWVQCALYCKLDAKYSAHPPVYALWSVVPAIYKVFTAPDSQAKIFNWTYLACNWRYTNTSMRVILQTWCQIQRTSSSLRCVKCDAGHIQSIYSSAYLDFNIHLNISALLLEIPQQINASYTANWVPNTAHIPQFTLCELWSRSYTMHLQLRIFRLQYSTVGICAAIVDITSIQCASYCKLRAKDSAHPPVYATWTSVPDIYNAFTAPHIYASIFRCRHLRYYCRYQDNSMRVILQIWCQI
jgi:hypothetical protein